MNNFADRIISFYKGLNKHISLPEEVEIMNPYQKSEVISIIECYYQKFYNDNNQRIYLVGINPGRFGGGVTGIPFTDPVNLHERCGFENKFIKRQELSSKFIYKLIESFGGEEIFFSKFFLTTLYPLALVKNGNNYNYYDDKVTWTNLKRDILKLFERQLNAGASKNVVICLGKKNEKYLREINNELNYFENIITFEHPRYIMQYKLKKLDDYLNNYTNQLNKLINEST